MGNNTGRNFLLIGGAALGIGLLLSKASQAQNLTTKFKVNPLAPNDFNLQGGINFNLPVQIVNQSTFDVTINNLYISVQNNLSSNAQTPNWQDLFYMVTPVKNITIAKNAVTNINAVPLTAGYANAITIYQMITGSLSSLLKVSVRFEVLGGIEIPPIEFTVDAKQMLLPLKTLLKNIGLGNLGYSKSTHVRNIKDGSDFNRYFPLPNGNKTMVIKGTNPINTVPIMASQVDAELPQTKAIAQILKRSNIADTAKAVWQFAHDYIQYEYDDHMKPLADRDEVLRSPAQIWKERKTGVDCDDFTKFCISIFANLGITSAIKAISMRPDGALQHVYCIVPVPKNIDAKGYLVVDACLHEFNKEPKGITNQIIKIIKA
jgi:hypothetical protein